jgi:ribokinase
MTNLILVCGACNIDLIAYVHRMPMRGETLKGDSFSQGFGGKGANQAVQAAKLGAATAMIGKVGQDTFGSDTLANFERFNVCCRHVTRTNQASSGVAPILVDAAGHNQIVIVNGANDLLTDQDIDNALSFFANSQSHSHSDTDCSSSSSSSSSSIWMVCQLELSVARTEAALSGAKRRGFRTFLNVAPAPVDDDGVALVERTLLPLADVVCPNEVELLQLVGLRGAQLDDTLKLDDDDDAFLSAISRAAQALLAKCRPDAVLLSTLGGRGALLSFAKNRRNGDDANVDVDSIERARTLASSSAVHILIGGEAVPRERIVDTSGAGDSFVGALVAHLNGTLSNSHEPVPVALLIDAIQYAHTIASQSIQQKGTQSSYVSKSSIS